MNYTLKNISKIFNAEFSGNGDYFVNKVSSIENASETSIVFLSNKKYLELLEITKSKEYL